MFATACGRFGFDTTTGSVDGNPDTPVCSAPPAVVEQVTSGILVIGATEAMHVAPLSVPLDRSVLFSTLREAEPSPTYGLTACELTASGVQCTRPMAGTDYASSTGEITVRYTVVVFASGVTVQRGTESTPPPLAINAVPLASSFVLLGGADADIGNSYGTNEYVRAELMASSVDVRDFDVTMSPYRWQVVSVAGATVERGTQLFPAGTLMSSQGLTTVTAGSFPLVSYTADSNISASAAGGALLARIAQSSLVLERDDGTMPLDASWEVITLPFAATRGETTLVPGQLQATVSVPGLHGATSVALASSQPLFGPSSGRTDYSGPEVDLVGEASVTLSAFDDSIVLERATADSQAVFEWVAIDFSRPICP